MHNQIVAMETNPFLTLSKGGNDIGGNKTIVSFHNGGREENGG
jgi:hypothetical protein